MHDRRNFLKNIGIRLGSLSLWSLLPFAACVSGRSSGKLLNLLDKAGNAPDERSRFLYLKEAVHLPDLDPALRSDLAELLRVVDHWANGKENFDALGQSTGISDAYLCGFFNRKVRPDAYILPQLPEDHPLFPLIAFYRARMLVAQVIQHGDLQHDEQLRSSYYSEARALFQKAEQAYPRNARIGMYLGRPIPWPAGSEADPNAPLWANLQHECLEKLTDIIHWWIDNRQVGDGQFGGGWGDDVEMWRNWLPVLVAFDDPKVQASQALLSEGLFSLDRMQGGYTNYLTDVEHTAEDSADTCTAMMHIDPTNSVWSNRALRLIELMRDSWTGINERGFLQFKSTYFTSEEVDLTPRKACDTVYHPRAIQPALLQWQRTGDPFIGSLITEWMKTWVDAAARAERGKPAGILPSAIHWPEGYVGGVNETWWKPGNYTSNPLYVWPSAMYMMVNTLLLTYYKTKDVQFLEPLFSMARIYRQYGTASDTEEVPPGSLKWCARQMHRFMPDVLGKYRVLTQDQQWDDLLAEDADGYVQYRLTGNTYSLISDLKKNVQAFAHNFAAFTDEVRWTDRVFSFADAYLNQVESQEIPKFQAQFLFSTLTGNIGNALYFPLNAVRWRTHSRGIAILVSSAGRENFQADLYNFQSTDRQIGADLFLLEPGNYKLQLSRESGKHILIDEKISLNHSTAKVNFKLPPATLCTLKIYLE